jgi:hypothetical protein
MSRKRGRSDDDDVEEEDSPSRLFQGPVLDPPYTLPPIPPITEERLQMIRDREESGAPGEDVSMSEELPAQQHGANRRELQALWNRFVSEVRLNPPLYTGPVNPSRNEVNMIGTTWMFFRGMGRVRLASWRTVFDVAQEGLRKIRQNYRGDRFMSDPFEDDPEED